MKAHKSPCGKMETGEENMLSRDLDGEMETEREGKAGENKTYEGMGKKRTTHQRNLEIGGEVKVCVGGWGG